MVWDRSHSFVFDRKHERAKVVHVREQQALRHQPKEEEMGKKDGKPEPKDIGSNMRIKVSKETQKKIQENQKKKK